MMDDELGPSRAEETLNVSTVPGGAAPALARRAPLPTPLHERLEPVRHRHAAHRAQRRGRQEPRRARLPPPPPHPRRPPLPQVSGGDGGHRSRESERHRAARRTTDARRPQEARACLPPVRRRKVVAPDGRAQCSVRGWGGLWAPERRPRPRSVESSRPSWRVMEDTLLSSAQCGSSGV